MDKYNEMLERANKRYKYSEIERDKIISLLDYCHANDVRMTPRRMYEVFYLCDAMPGRELSTDMCNSECAKYYGCSICTVVDDAECLINQDKSVLDLEPSDEFYFKPEVKSVIRRYHGEKSDKMPDSELDMIVEEFRKELKCLNHCIAE